MVMQWLNIFEGTPGASNAATGEFGGGVSGRFTQVSNSVDRFTTQYLGSSKPYFAAFGIGVLAVAGAATTWELSKGIVSYFLAGPLHLGLNLKKLGAWAVVTGSNTGIGRVYALELAQRGFNIVLVARNEEKLKVTAKEIEDIHHVHTKIIVADFENATVDNYLHVQAQLQGMDIGVLVNNAGLGPEDPMVEFLDNPPDAEKCVALVNVNVSGYVMMTRIILPQMVLARKGCIINISSVNGDIPSPKSALYSATKAFVDFFSQALHAEYKGKGITVQCVMPGAVMTKMVQEKDKSSYLCVSPEEFVPSALAQVGLRNRTYGHWKHGLHMKRKKVRTWLQSLM